MKKTITLFVLLVCVFTVKAQTTTKETETKPPPNKYANAKFEWKIIDAPNNTHGYDIYADGDLLIHQTNIPGMPGNDGFKTKIDAQNCAKYIITKIQKGEMPPTVTPEELKKIRVLH